MNWVVIEFYVGKWLKKRNKLADCSVRRSSHVRQRNGRRQSINFDRTINFLTTRRIIPYCTTSSDAFCCCIFFTFYLFSNSPPPSLPHQLNRKNTERRVSSHNGKKYIIFPSKCGTDTTSACLYSEACVRHLCQPLAQQPFTDSRFYRLEIVFRGPFSTATEIYIQIEYKNSTVLDREPLWQ